MANVVNQITLFGSCGSVAYVISGVQFRMDSGHVFNLKWNVCLDPIEIVGLSAATCPGMGWVCPPTEVMNDLQTIWPVTVTTQEIIDHLESQPL